MGEGPVRTVRVAAAVIMRDGKIFATQRGYGPYKDYWEFPGGKLEQDETAEQALVREIREELDTLVRPVRHLARVEYDYPDFHLSMDCFLCDVLEGALILKEHESARWLAPKDLPVLRWLPADADVVRTLSELIELRGA